MSTAFKLDRQLFDYLELIPGEEERLIVAQAAVLSPLGWFCPNGAQERFISAVSEACSESKVPVVLFTAANGIGKTEVNLHLLCNIIYGSQNGWFDHEIYKGWAYPKEAWYVTTRNALETVINKRLQKMLIPGTYKPLARGKPYTSAYKFKNGWSLTFFTQDQDTKEMESTDVGLIIGDEPFTVDIWNALKSRRRMGCVTLLPMTPLDVEPFVIDEVESAAKRKRKGYRHVEADVYLACRRRGVRGHLDPEVLDEMVKDYDESEKEARVYGKFMYFRERIYPGLNPDKHWVDPIDYPLHRDESKTYCVVDPHDGRPCAVIWGQIQAVEHSDKYKALIAQGAAKQQYRYVIFYEYPQDNDIPFWEMRDRLTLSEQLADWLMIEETRVYEPYRLKVGRRVLDRVFGWQTRSGNTFANLFAAEARARGKSFVCKRSYSAKGTGVSDLPYGHSAVRELLLDLEDGRPGLVIYKNCWHTWNGMVHYIRSRARGTDTSKAVGETKIVPKYADFPDAVRYFCCERVYGREGEAVTTLNRRRKRYTKNPIAAISDGL